MALTRKPAAATQSKIIGQSNSISIAEITLSVAMIVLVSAVFLWNWDGFWQTRISPLVSVQRVYFPAKYKYENDKLANIESNALDLTALVDRVDELQHENVRLNAVLDNLQQENMELHLALETKHMDSSHQVAGIDDDATTAVDNGGLTTDEILDGVSSAQIPKPE